MDTEGSDIDVTELDDCLKELEAIDISDLELSDNEQNLDSEKLAAHEEDVNEKTECKPLENSELKSFLPSSEVERSAEFELEGTAQINFPSRCTGFGENYEMGMSRLPCTIGNETEDAKPKLEFQTNLSVTELREILKSTIDKGILENKNKSDIPVELSDKIPVVVKDSVRLPCGTKREETKQLASTLGQHVSDVEPILSPEITLPPKFSPTLESTPKRKHCQKDNEEDDNCQLDDTTDKVDTIVKQEVPEPVPEDTEVALSENESTALLKRAGSEASLSSCETVIFERRSPLDDQRLCRRPSSDIEEVNLVKSIIQNLEALEACDSLEAISPDSMSSPPPLESVDKAVTADLSENDIDYKKERRKKKRKKKKTKKRHEKKKKGDNEKDELSDASFSSDDYFELEKKPLRSLNYFTHSSSKKRSPLIKTNDRRSSPGSPNCSLPFPPTRQLSSHISLRRPPHGCEPVKYEPNAVHYERKLRQDGSSSSPSPSRSRRRHKRLLSTVKKSSVITSRSPTHSPPHRSLHSKYTKKRYEPLRSRSKSPLWKRRYRRRSRSRSFSPHNRKYSTTARRKHPKSSKTSESPVRLSPDVRSDSPLERKISRRLKKLESLKKASRWRSKSRSSSPKIKPSSTKERKPDSEYIRGSKSPNKTTLTVISNTPPAKIISESEKQLSSPKRQSTSPKRRHSSSPVAQQPSVGPTDTSQSSGLVGNPETHSESLSKPASPSPEKKVPPTAESRTPTPPSVSMKMDKSEPMDISPTPETKLLKETPHPVLNADFTKLPPVPSLVMQLPSMWSQPPPPGTLPVCDTQKPPPPPGTLPVPYGVQPLPSTSTLQHTLPLQSQQQQMHSSFTYSHPQVQGMYQNGSSGFGLPGYSQSNNHNNFQQQSLYGCQTFTFPQVTSNSSNPVGHPTQFQSTYDSPVNRQDMSVPPPVYNQSQKYQPNLISHNIAQYPSQGGNHTTPYVMQNPQQVHNIMQSPQNIPQTQIKINVQQVLHPQNTNSQSLNRTSPFASCRDPRLKDINISVSCEAPIPLPSVGTQINTATISNQSSSSMPQKVTTTAQMPLPGQPPLPPGQPPLPPGQPPLLQGQPPLPPGQPPLPPGQPPLPPKEMKIEQPPLPKSPPPPSTPPYSKMPEAQDKSLMSSTARPQQTSSLISHLQLNVKKLLPSKKVESVVTTSASEQCGKQRQNSQDQQPENQRDLNKCVCEKTGVEKKICLNCLYKKKEKASVFSHTPNLSRSVKRPIVVNLLHKRKTQPVTAIVKPNVHEIQTSSSSSEQPHQQEAAMTASNSNSPYSETRTHDSTESVTVLAKQRIDKQCADVLNGKSAEIVANIPFPEHQTNFRHVDTSSSHKNSDVKTDVVIGKVTVSHTKGNLVDDSEKGVPEEQIRSLETEEHTRKTVKNDEQTSEIKESLKDSVVLKQKDIDLNRVKSTSFQMKNENASKNKYLNSIIVGNKWNKKVSVLPRTYRSKSADSMLDSEKQSAKEHAKVPKDDLLPTIGNSCLMHESNRMGNNTLHPIQKAEGNKDEHRDQQKTNYTNKPSSKHQISLSEKVKESDILNNREINAASPDKNTKETVLTAHIPNNNGKLDYARLKPSDMHLSGIKLECITEEPTQDTSEIKLEHVSEGHTQVISEIKLESVAEGPTQDISEIKLESVSEGPPEDIFESAISLKKESLESDGGCVDLGSLCSIVKTKCHESIKSVNDSIATSSYDKSETEKLSNTTDVSSDNRLKLQNPPIHLNNDVAASVKSTDCISSGNVMCGMGKEGKTNIQHKSFKNENSDPSISMQTERQIDTEHCRKDERMHTAVDSAPVTPENALRRPLNEDSSCVEGGKVTKTAVSYRALDSLGNIQQPTISVSQSKSQEKERGGLLDNVAPKVSGDFRVAHLLHEKSECHRGEVMQQKLLKKIVVECEEEKDDRVQRSRLSERSVNIIASDSSDSDIIELPTTIDLCLSDDADDVHEVPVPPKVLPIVDVNNDKPIVLSDSECITVDASPKKEISQTNVKNIDVTPSISSAPLLVPQENCVSVTDSMLPAEQLDKMPCLNSNLCISSMQRKDTSLLQTLLAMPSDVSKEQSDNNRVPLTERDICKSPPSSKLFITDTLLSQMKPAPRSVKLQHAAVLQDKHMHDKLSDLCSAKVQKMELDEQSAIRTTETKDTPSFSEKNFKGDSLKNKRNFSVLSDDSNNEKNYNAPSNLQQKDGEPCLKKQKQSSLIENDEQIESDQTITSIRDHPKRAQKSNLSVTVLQPINIIPSESREGTLSFQVQRYSSRILRSPQKNTVIFAKYVGSTDIISNEEDCSNEDITTAQLEKVVSKSEKTIKKYPHRSQLPSYAVSRRILISRLRRCPVVLQANFKKMAKLLRQDFKLTQIPLVVLEQIDLQLEQSKKITQNLDLKRSTSRCCCCQVLCRSIATQTDDDHTKCN